jgi:tripartite-type tricarboxylate transporter receptor subunit TctC
MGTGAIVVSPSLGVKSVQEFIAYAKERPGKILLGSAGAGSVTHLTGERFRLGAGIQSVHVGFKGPSEVMIEIVAGRIHFGYTGLMSAMPFIKDGRLLPLAVNTMQRSPLLPDVPAMPEVLPDWVREGASAVLVPARTPLPIRTKISKEIARILELPDVKERLQATGFVADPCTPQEHDVFLRAQIDNFAGIIRLAGLRTP